MGSTGTSPRPSGERRFYTGMALVMLATVLGGFARSFFLRPWFPDWPSPPEPIFYLHGGLFTAWMVLLLVQARLVGARRIELHRRVGWWGAGLALAMVVVGAYSALVAARRPTGFVGIPIPGPQFLVVPLADTLLFATFTAFAIATRARAQAHKRWILLATVNLLTAAIARLPGVMGGSPLVFFGLTDLFLVALAVWDLRSRRRIHPVTLWGGLAIVVSQPLRLVISGTAPWMAFARRAMGLLD